MISFIFRAFAWFILAGGVIIAIVDATRSVAAQQLQLTRVGETLATYMPRLADRLAKAKLDCFHTIGIRPFEAAFIDKMLFRNANRFITAGQSCGRSRHVDFLIINVGKEEHGFGPSKAKSGAFLYCEMPVHK